MDMRLKIMKITDYYIKDENRIHWERIRRYPSNDLTWDLCIEARSGLLGPYMIMARVIDDAETILVSGLGYIQEYTNYLADLKYQEAEQKAEIDAENAYVRRCELGYDDGPVF